VALPHKYSAVEHHDEQNTAYSFYLLMIHVYLMIIVELYGLAIAYFG
jgi:hypothetical protein